MVFGNKFNENAGLDFLFDLHELFFIQTLVDGHFISL